MKATQILKSAVLGVSLAGLGLIAGPLAARAAMPSGYTLSPKAIKGQYCYRHNNEASLYCYRTRLTGSTMMQHDSMIKGNSMMKKDDGTMMKK
jgi:hypothetical protein